MRKIEIEIPEGKKAEWLNGVLTLVDENLPKFKFNIGDRVTINSSPFTVFTIDKQLYQNGEPYYELDRRFGYCLPYKESELTLFACEPEAKSKFNVGDIAVLKNDTGFKQGDGVCLISAGTEVEIMSVSNCINDTDKLYEVKYQNATTVVKGGDIIPIEPKPVEYKFDVGDKASLNRDVCFIQVSGDYDLVNAGAEVEIVKVLDSADASEKKYRIKHHYSTAVVLERDLDKIEFRFNVGDKVIYPRLADTNEIMTITEKLSINGCPCYNLITDKNIKLQCLEEDIHPYVPQDIINRIKTFHDAVEWCSENGYGGLVLEYNVCAFHLGDISTSKDILTYLKLCIITVALNEGWEPIFEKNEMLWCVEYDCTNNIYEVNYHLDWLTSSSKLVFKSKELAEYASVQFRDLYGDFYGVKEGQ